MGICTKSSENVAGILVEHMQVFSPSASWFNQSNDNYIYKRNSGMAH
jgi:hypothetical protein